MQLTPSSQEDEGIDVTLLAEEHGLCLKVSLIQQMQSVLLGLALGCGFDSPVSSLHNLILVVIFKIFFLKGPQDATQCHL